MFRQAILMSAIGGMIALSVPAQAQERRVGNAAMGAATGLVVGGPIGFVAGGAIGFFEGENIARGIGIRHKHYRYRYTADGRRYRVYY